MKTAMQTYIDDLKEGNCKGEQFYLDMEKDKLENSYIQGFCNCEYDGVMDFDKYYTSTFNNQ